MTEKLKIVAMSDLHNEFEREGGPGDPSPAWLDLQRKRQAIEGHPHVGPMLDHLRGEGVDLVILAGDIDLEDHGVAYADRVSSFLGVPVVYVMGNHEAYGADLDNLVPHLRAAAGATGGRVAFLENDSMFFDIKGRRIHLLGCCLFTDYRLNGNGEADISLAMLDAGSGLNDHFHIRMRGSLFSPAMAREIHDGSRAWLARETARIRSAEGDEAEIVLVTHHAPIPEANAPDYRGNRLAPAFASDMRAEIAEWRPTAWIWGHTHWTMEAAIGQTKLLSSQRGYVCIEPGAESFVPTVVEL
ncbi:metallophosphoesterase [Methylocystis parvus]|uniref:metallophosphoesterase n=1 Tax=Methylocystis parvus TaxID=134 RepID=UPI003C73E8AF